MARTKNPRFLQKKGRTWYAALDIPKDVRGHFDGKARFVRSLETESETEAENKVRMVVSHWKEQIAAARRGEAPHRIPHEQLARDWRRDVECASVEELDTLLEVLPDHASRLNFQDDENRDTFVRFVRGETEVLQDHLPGWLDSLSDQQPKTIDMKRSDVERFVGRFRTAEAVTPRALTAWVDELSETVASATIRRKFSAVRTFWTYLQRKGKVDGSKSPFDNVQLPKKAKTKSAFAEKRQPFEPRQVVELWTAAKQRDSDLADLIWIAMWTGCRIEEICSMRVVDLADSHVHVAFSKSEKGIRDVPVHPRLKTRLQELADNSTDGFLISGLTRNKYRDRSNALGKRFGRLKKQKGYGEPHVFHSIRKTVSTSLENAGVPENVSADILGHKKPTITYGLYSGGTSMERRLEAIAKIDYPT